MRKHIYSKILFLVFILLSFSMMAQDLTKAPEKISSFQMLKKYFIEGDWVWMSPVLIVFIFGLAFCIERIIVLNLASIDTDKFLGEIDDKLSQGKIDEAIAFAKSQPGPAASIVSEGLSNIRKGNAGVEKAITNYGAVQISLLEKGLVWISLFISIAPMLGFLGTVVGMIQAFDKIEAAGDLSPSIVAGGIKVALLTTVFGLIVALVLQVFYNYLIAKIDTITNKMDDSAISFMTILEKNNIVNP
jgi:biopolymer transport protein ExbB